MSVSIKIDVDTELDEAVQSALRVMTGPQRRQTFQIAGRASTNALKKYHRNFNAQGRWSKRGGGPSEFGEEVTRGWGMSRVDVNGVVITNAAPHFAFKITGGTITPKRRRALTIPLIPEARGRFAEVFERVTGKKLFIPRGTSVLAYKDKSDPKGFRAVYALVRSVTHKPWPGAMPKEEVYLPPYVESILDTIAGALGI